MINVDDEFMMLTIVHRGHLTVVVSNYIMSYYVIKQHVMVMFLLSSFTFSVFCTSLSENSWEQLVLNVYSNKSSSTQK